jgi:hypothetical protein
LTFLVFVFMLLSMNTHTAGAGLPRLIGADVELEHDAEPAHLSVAIERATVGGPFQLASMAGTRLVFQLRRPDLAVGASNLAQLHTRLAAYVSIARIERINGVAS